MTSIPTPFGQGIPRGWKVLGMAVGAWVVVLGLLVAVAQWVMG